MYVTLQIDCIDRITSVQATDTHTLSPPRGGYSALLFDDHAFLGSFHLLNKTTKTPDHRLPLLSDSPQSRENASLL